MKGVDMFKKLLADIKAALTVIAAENLHAMRIIFRNITHSVYRSTRTPKRT